MSGAIPLLVRRGGRDIKKISRSHLVRSGRGGRSQTVFCERPPRLRRCGSYATFLLAQPPLLCRAPSSPISGFSFQEMHRSKQEHRHERFIRGDALAAEVSLSIPDSSPPNWVLRAGIGMLQLRIVPKLVNHLLDD
jgi:hypothetical protein